MSGIIKVVATAAFVFNTSTSADNLSLDSGALVETAKRFATKSEADLDKFEDWLLQLPNYCQIDKRLSHQAKEEMARSLLLIAEARHHSELIARAKTLNDVPIDKLTDELHGISAHNEKFIVPVVEQCRRARNAVK